MVQYLHNIPNNLYFIIHTREQIQIILCRIWTVGTWDNQTIQLFGISYIDFNGLFNLNVGGTQIHNNTPLCQGTD